MNLWLSLLSQYFFIEHGSRGRRGACWGLISSSRACDDMGICAKIAAQMGGIPFVSLSTNFNMVSHAHIFVSCEVSCPPCPKTVSKLRACFSRKPRVSGKPSWQVRGTMIDLAVKWKLWDICGSYVRRFVCYLCSGDSQNIETKLFKAL